MTERRLDQLRAIAEAKLGPLIETVRARVGRASSPPPSAPSVPPPAAAAEPPRTSPDDVERLVAQLEQSPTWQARTVAAIALAELHGDRVVDALVKAVRDPSTEVAVAAVEALACQPDPRAGNDLREVLRDTAGFVGPFTRAAAVEAIAKCQGLVAVPLLIETLHDGDAEVSMAAVVALARVAPAEAAPHLMSLLEDRSGYYLPVVRVTAAKALERAGAVDAARAAALLETESNEGVRVVLARIVRDAPARV